MNRGSTPGYLLGFIIYTGASTDYSTGNTLNLLTDFDSYKSPSKVVLHLLEKYIRQGYIVTLDNYYNSPELAETLLQLQTDWKICFQRFLEVEVFKRRPSSLAISRRCYVFAMKRYHKNKEYKVCKHVINNSYKNVD